MTELDSRQSVNRAALDKLDTAVNEQLNVVLDQTNTEFDFPLRLAATFPTPDANLHIRSAQAVAADGAQKSPPPVNGLIVSFVDSTINFQLATTTGGTFLPNTGAGTITFPVTTVGQYRRAVFSLLDTGEMQVNFTPEVVSQGALANPGAFFVTTNAIPVGWIDLQATAATAFRTAGSVTSVIENDPAGSPAIFRVSSAVFTSPPPLAIPNVFLSPLGQGTATTFAEAISELPVDGGVILLMDDITVNSVETFPAYCKIIGREKNATITLGASGSLVFSSPECKIEDLRIFTADNITAVDVFGGDLFIAENCKIELPPAGSAIGIRIRANGTHIEQCEFNGTTGGSTSSGIQYDVGYSENTAENNIGTP